MIGGGGGGGRFSVESFRAPKPFLINLRLITERCKRLELLAWREPLFILRVRIYNSSVIIRFAWDFATPFRKRKLFRTFEKRAPGQGYLFTVRVNGDFVWSRSVFAIFNLPFSVVENLFKVFKVESSWVPQFQVLGFKLWLSRPTHGSAHKLYSLALYKLLTLGSNACENSCPSILA